jgi:hypothetical protein
MEMVNPLDQLQQLEKKVTLLIGMVRDEKVFNEQLAQENKELIGRLEALENSLLKETKSMEELHQERALTKNVVDELISSIDKLVEERV